MNPSRAQPRRPRPSPRLTRYLIAEMVFPSLVAIAAFGLVVLMTDLLGYAELIVNRGLGIAEVRQLALLQLVPTLARTLPFAVLVGILVGLGRLSADRELLALETSGFSARQLSRPGLYFALFATLVSIMLSLYGAPAAQRAVRDQMIRLTEENPGLSLRPSVASQIGEWRIEAREVEKEGSELGSVLLYMPSLGETVFSQSGAIRTDEDGAKTIELHDGLMLANGTTRASLLRFDSMETDLPEIQASKDLPVNIYSTLAFEDLRAGVLNDPNPAHTRLMRIEIHRRIALGAAALPFGLLAMGLALSRRNLSRSSGAIMGIIGAIAYYALVQLSEGMLRDKNSPVVWVAWIPNLTLIAVATTLIFRAGRTASASDRGSGRSGVGLLERLGLARPGIRMRRWALPRYISAQFLKMVFASIFGLAFAYLIIDVFDNLKWFNTYGATAAEIGRFYGARIPVLMARIVPMALLIAVALTISIVGAHGELLGMRACGIPVFRVLAPVWLLCGLAVPADHLLANEVVPRASERASFLKKTEIKNQEITPTRTQERVWYRLGTRIHEMEKLDMLRGQANNITLYDLGDDGLPIQRTDAETALHIGEGRWLTDKIRAVGLEGDRIERQAKPERVLQFREEVPTEIDTANLTPNQLRARIADLALEGPLEATYQTALQMKLAAPLACLLLPMIALFFAATGPPFPRPVHTLIAAAIIAVTHALVTSIAGSMGQGGSLSPWVAGWSPAIIYGVVAFAMGVRLRLRHLRAG